MISISWVLGLYYVFSFEMLEDSDGSLFQCGDRLQTSESVVYKRQILTSEVDPRTERTKNL